MGRSPVQHGKGDAMRLGKAIAAAIATHAAIADAHHTPVAAQVAVEATVALFQANPATGTFSTAPQNTNDNNTGTQAQSAATDQYAEVDFDKVVLIRRWRQFGSVSNNGDGTWKIQYYNLATHAWVDWVTGIVTRVTADWSSLTTETEVLTDRIRLVNETLDSGQNRVGELEVYY